MFLQLCLWMLLFSEWSPTGHSKYRSPPEVVVPLRVTDFRKRNPPDWLSYRLYFGGQRHIITLEPKKNFISRSFLLFTYSDKGDLLAEQPFVKGDCYYHGYVDEDPESTVIINTCLGSLQGILGINGTTYEIMPKGSTSTFEHLAYKMDSEESESIPMKCALTEEEIARQVKLQESSDSILLQNPFENWWTHHKYIEYFVVLDNKRYVHRKNNTTKCLHDILLMVNSINKYYTQIDLEVVLTSLEIWTEKNHVNVEESIFKVLPNFCNWKAKNIGNKIRHDIIHLFARQGYGKYLGLANVATVCSGNNCAVNSFVSDSMSDMGFIIAHEMGHNLGMSHDKYGCTCGRRQCIMAPYKSNSDKFSNCSYSEMFSVVMRKTCVHNIPDVAMALNTTATCGNNIVEEGEQCDCGDSDSCVRDSCCGEDCNFRSGAQCAFGLCCKDCQFIKPGTVCREEQSECDLPEWCNGTSAECPEDAYKEDGSPCTKGYCYEMQCHGRQEQCQRIFGNEARSANEICYMEMNKRGDRFGNCGNNSYTYRRCNPTDVLCGRIQCENVQKIPQGRSHETVHWTHFQNMMCWSMEYHFGSRLYDSGSVKDGTPCGSHQLCIKGSCVRKSVLHTNCSERACNMHGICNNKRHCHCRFKWAPPYCLALGFGGSIDSGPPPGTITKKPPPKHKKNLAFRCVAKLPVLDLSNFVIAAVSSTNFPLSSAFIVSHK
ncbi:disintegrin and metalloproteinase domain-containing protein 26A-like [Acomys russatus]|uniref:disintegrin and metalloproteinase domain-containing protein 26A-like n=1 Tax=Acomys russatus TaxID=60746 RepID=UPI0021E2822B|nr:disintegrin and metalloproteinase domain-containing protein 26A-like [Acomys russatus]